jgi:tetratricopeptide (TPR) repeat protein
MMPSILNNIVVACTNTQGSRQRHAVALSLLALSVLSFAAIAGCSFPFTEGKTVSGLDKLIQGQSNHSVSAHPQPGWQAQPSIRTLVMREPTPHCELPGLEPDTIDVDLWSRLKHDYEQHCSSYKQAAMLVRRKLRGVAEAIIGDAMRDKGEGAKAAIPNAVAPTDSVVVQDTGAAATVGGPTSTGTVSVSSPPLEAKFYRESAIGAYRKDDLALALVNFDLAIRLDPSFEVAYIDRSIILYRLGAVDAAFDDVAQAKRIENSHRLLTPPLPKMSPIKD